MSDEQVSSMKELLYGEPLESPLAEALWLLGQAERDGISAVISTQEWEERRRKLLHDYRKELAMRKREHRGEGL